MNKPTYIGIDPSINSTGVAILKNDNYQFFRIASTFTKKELLKAGLCGENWSYNPILYKKFPKGETYSETELFKTSSLINIVSCIKKLCDQYNNIHISIEGISYGSVSRTSAIYDLAGLNYLIRAAFIDSFIYIVPPTELKKFATGKGNADKSLICTAFAGLFPEIKCITKYDDIADAFYLANIIKNFCET